MWRAEGLLCLSVLLAHVLLISTWSAWAGGNGVGPRYLLPILPFVIVPVAFCVQTWRDKPPLLALTWGLVGLSFIVIWMASVSGQGIFAPTDVANPLTGYLWPKFRAGDITRNIGMVAGLSSWYGLLPPVLLVGCTSWVIRRESAAGSACLEKPVKD